jgi:hypothetical protein
MKNGSTTRRTPGVSFLASILIGGLVLHSSVSLANDCADTDTECTSSEPSIWPRQSKSYEDGSMPILGWNLVPDTSYQVVTLPPDGSVPTIAYVTTDSEGDFLGDDYELTQEERDLLSAGQPHVVRTAPTLNGVYEVRIYLDPWTGSLDEAPVASTTFLQN